jgi:enediyne polyketide synthase
MGPRRTGETQRGYGECFAHPLLRMAVITGWEFDLVKFGIPPITARTSDIAHWLALHTADVALKDSGLDLASVDRTRAGVMLGNSLTGEFSLAHHLRLRWPYAERALRRSLQNTETARPLLVLRDL